MARKTDVIPAKIIGGQANCELYLKTENLQLTGSFKLHGEYYKMAVLSNEEKAKGIVACSEGNHA